MQEPPLALPDAAADALVAVWTDVTRDLLLSQLGLDGSVRDIGRLDDTLTTMCDIWF